MIISDEDHFQNIATNLYEYVERLRKRDNDLSWMGSSSEKEYKANKKYLNWTELYMKIRKYLEAGSKLKLETIYEFIREAEYVQMPDDHAGYISILNYNDQYESWVYKYMQYLQQPSEYEHEYLSELVKEAEALVIDTDDILKNLKEDVTKHEIWRSEAEKIISKFNTLARSWSEIEDLDIIEEKVQSLLDEVVSPEYNDIITELHQAKWMIKVYKLIKSKDISNFNIWKTSHDSKYAVVDAKIPFLNQFYLEMNKALVIYNFVEEISKRSEIDEDNKLKSVTFKSHLENLKDLRMIMEHEQKYLEQILKDYEKIKADYTGIKGGIMNYQELCKLHRNIVKSPILIKKIPEKVLKKKKEVEELKNLIEEEVHSSDRIKMRHADELLEKYSKLKWTFKEGEELRANYEESKRIIKELEIVDETYKYNQIQIRELKEKLKRISVNMGRDELILRSKVWKIRALFVINRIQSHNSFVKSIPSQKIVWRVIEDLANPPGWIPVQGSSEYQKIRKVYDRIVDEVVNEKISNWWSYKELKEIMNDLSWEIIDFSDWYKEQKSKIKIRLEESYKNDCGLGRSATLDLHEGINKQDEIKLSQENKEISANNEEFPQTNYEDMYFDQDINYLEQFY